MTVYMGATSLAECPDFSAQAVVDTEPTRLAPYVTEGINILRINDSNTTLYDFKIDFASLTEGWCSFYMYYGDTGTNNWDHNIWALVSSTGNFPLRLNKAINSATHRIYYSTSSGTGDTTITVSTGLHKWDIYWKIAADGTGQFDVYIDNVSVFSQSGQNNAQGPNVQSFYAVRKTNTSAGEFRVYSGFIFADQDTRNMKIVEQKPTGDGTTTDWNGDYTDVDEVGINTTDFIDTESAGNYQLFTFPALPGDVAGDDFVGMILSIAGIAATGDIHAAVRSDGVNYDGGLLLEEGFGVQKGTVLLPDDPDTSAPWALAAIDAAEFGVLSAA